MIISRTPLRISFFGGGTDYPQWYKQNGGSVISTSINKYTYVTLRYLPQFFEYKYKIRYYKKEEVSEISEIEHPTVRESLKYLKIKDGIELVHSADVPARSGLGSSSSFTVGLLHALHFLKKQLPGKRQLAHEAIDIEQNYVNEFVGSQDQVATAFGGLNKIDFNKKDNFTVNPLPIDEMSKKKLEESILIFFTGFSRNASAVAEKQMSRITKNINELNIMNSFVDKAADYIRNSNISDFGMLMNENWERKKRLSPYISNHNIDLLYNLGIKSGAYGGKLLGAGSGGFMLFIAPKKNRKKIISELKNYLHVPILFDNLGSQIIYHKNE